MATKVYWKYFLCHNQHALNEASQWYSTFHCWFCIELGCFNLHQQCLKYTSRRCRNQLQDRLYDQLHGWPHDWPHDQPHDWLHDRPQDRPHGRLHDQPHDPLTDPITYRPTLLAVSMTYKTCDDCDCRFALLRCFLFVCCVINELYALYGVA